MTGKAHPGKAAITGGAGLIGSHIADLLADSGCEIVILDDFSRGSRTNIETAMRHGRTTVIDGDVRNRGLVREALRGADVVFHQAAIRITQCAADPRLAFEVLAEGTFNVVEAAREEGVRRIVAASSASVYGLAEEFPTSERHHSYNNRTFYGAAKSFNEALLRSFHEMYGLNYVALRYFNVYGPRMDTYGAYTEVLVRWMERIAAGLPPIIYGHGTESMDFIYVADVARANILAATAAATDAVFNIGSGVETTLEQLARTLIRVMGSNVGLEYAPPRKVNPVTRRMADVSAATRELGFTSRVSLEDGLRRLVSWWYANRQAAETAHV
jgi:UDP-glucose 4-epimerase